MLGTRGLFSLPVKTGETDKLNSASLEPWVNYGKWRAIVTGAQLMNPGPPVMDGWMEMNINLLSLAPMMSF